MKSRVAPNQLENPNFEALKKVCAEYIQEVAAGGYVDDDFVHYIFEASIEALYGKEVWKFVNGWEKFIEMIETFSEEKD
jgi:hypothetical protein